MDDKIIYDVSEEKDNEAQ